MASLTGYGGAVCSIARQAFDAFLQCRQPCRINEDFRQIIFLLRKLAWIVQYDDGGQTRHPVVNYQDIEPLISLLKQQNNSFLALAFQDFYYHL